MNQDRVLHKTFEPGQIGRVEVKNRIIMPAMQSGFGDAKGRLIRKSVHYYAERGRGGVGLIIFEGANPHEFGRSQPLQPNIYDDKYIPELKGVADAVHLTGGKIGMQLIFSGVPALVGVAQLAAPSPMGSKARGLSKEEIKIIVEAFGDSARRAKVAGYDLVEIHACHGSLPCLFLSPYYNRRTDEYGGAEGRTKFALEILRSIKEKAGYDFPVIFRINGQEYRGNQGQTLEDAKIVAKKLEEGGVDALSISSGIETRDQHEVFCSSFLPPGFKVPLAAEIKKVVRVSVIASGGITDPRMAEEILQSGCADFVAMGRALIADPYLPRKAQEGKFDDIRPCVRCCEGCCGRIQNGREITCLGNAAVGKEEEYPIKRAEKSKKVLIIGGGPGGMEAARVLAMRGHEVILHERTQKLGGQLRLAAIPPYKGELGKLVTYLSTQVEKLRVKVELGKETSAQEVVNLKPDAVILAVGADPLLPPIAGVNGENVVTAHDVLDGKAKTGDKVIVIGGGRVGCETAEFLADQGKKVTIVELLDEMARDFMFAPNRQLLLKRLEEKGVRFLKGTKVKECNPKGIVTLKGVFGAPPEEEETCDTIVMAAGAVPRKEMLEELKGKVAELYRIGDCQEPRNALEAIHEGSHIARLL